MLPRSSHDGPVVHRGWRGDAAGLFSRVRECVAFPDGEDRATGYVFHAGEQEWPAPLAAVGPALLAELAALVDVSFTVVAVQAYRNGSGADWHADLAWDAQAILSLGASRSFGLSRDGTVSFVVLHAGDLLFMPSGFQASWLHCVPEEPLIVGERCSLVFRTVAR